MDRALFTLYENTNDSSVTRINGNTIMQYQNFDLYKVMPYLYWNYTAFNIKLESFSARTNFYADIDKFCLLHIRGLPWVNGYDTLETYQDSRVIELVAFEPLNNGSFNFPSNTNQIMFFRPSTPQVTLQFFLTNVTNGTIVAGGDVGARLFSISGIEKYRVNHFKRYKEISNKTINFVLKTSGATMLDTRNRAFKWSLNMKEIMGSVYDEYSQYKIVTMYLQQHQGAVNPYSFAGYYYIAFTLSGLPWVMSSFATVNLGLNDDIYHTERKTVIGLGSFQAVNFKEMYVENVFDRPKQNSDIVLTYGSVYGESVIGATAGVTTFTNFTIQFIIIPLK